MQKPTDGLPLDRDCDAANDSPTWIECLSGRTERVHRGPNGGDTSPLRTGGGPSTRGRGRGSRTRGYPTVVARNPRRTTGGSVTITGTPVVVAGAPAQRDVPRTFRDGRVLPSCENRRGYINRQNLDRTDATAPTLSALRSRRARPRHRRSVHDGSGSLARCVE